MTFRARTTAILLAGGSGTRMQASMPKQFLSLGEKPLARYSFDVFMSMPEITEVIVVCAPVFRDIFDVNQATKPIRFALPGERRQDSVYNGFLTADTTSELICVHDAARPFIDRELVLRALKAGKDVGAATVGMPIKFTVKECDRDNFVNRTPDRTYVWEIQTPQVIRRDILQAGFAYAIQNGVTVTDDTSLAELIGKKVKLVEGSYSNLKITVPADLAIANSLMLSMKS